jgi:hypothetical protein
MCSNSLLWRLAPAALLLMASGTLSAAVDEALLDMAPPDTRVLFGLEVQQALASPFGHFALSRMPEQTAALLHFAATTGFDLRRDLRELLLASSSGMRGKPVKDGVILARGVFERGVFEPGKLSALAGNIHARVSSYAGVPLIVPADSRSGVIAILDAATLAVGSESAVQGVIKRRQQRFLFSGPIADKARTASVNTDAWMATVTPLEDLISAAAVPLPSTFRQAVTESAASVRFDTSGATLSAELLTRSAIDAVALAGMFKIVAGMLKGSAAPLLRNARFTSEGAIARATLTIAEEDLESAFPAPVEGRAAR